MNSSFHEFVFSVCAEPQKQNSKLQKRWNHCKEPNNFKTDLGASFQSLKCGCVVYMLNEVSIRQILNQHKHTMKLAFSMSSMKHLKAIQSNWVSQCFNMHRVRKLIKDLTRAHDCLIAWLFPETYVTLSKKLLEFSSAFHGCFSDTFGDSSFSDQEQIHRRIWIADHAFNRPEYRTSSDFWSKFGIMAPALKTFCEGTDEFAMRVKIVENLIMFHENQMIEVCKSIDTAGCQQDAEEKACAGLKSAASSSSAAASRPITKTKKRKSADDQEVTDEDLMKQGGCKQGET